MAGNPTRVRDALGRYPRTSPEFYACVECGSQFPHKKSGRTKHLYCTRKCAAVARSRRAAASRVAKPEPVRRCVVCSMEFAARKNITVCSSQCLRERNRRLARNHYYEKRKPMRVLAKPCIQCGAEFVASRSGQGTCSPLCGELRRRETTRAAKSRRKARQRGANAETVRPSRVFSRDGWCCYLCGQSTPSDLRGTCADNAPEMDHVVPLAAGGAHSYDNVRCACRRCNQLKSDAPLDAFIEAYGLGAMPRQESDASTC